jgi:hypothetical protein
MKSYVKISLKEYNELKDKLKDKLENEKINNLINEVDAGNKIIDHYRVENFYLKNKKWYQLLFKK